ncbi:uncharacterized protein NEMAJ01_0007 [Nematocida major]|uniref:uncharacterized protein n=1 Tax=Nematocida major TaxID=1912982 RepID=UPI0020074F7A|nr:uncharacterized protein NEMAJ01_0007 [Nematocida major]KAH9385111.1 hypothetical protein NEMAJ01_0007 [Nematocida major]
MNGVSGEGLSLSVYLTPVVFVGIYIIGRYLMHLREPPMVTNAIASTSSNEKQKRE